MHSWIVARIEAISERMGIRHALGLARVLKMGKEIAFWDDAKLKMKMGMEEGREMVKEEDDGWEASSKVLLTSDRLLS